jgi:hypothetical protein
VHNLANIALRPPTSWGAVFGFALVSSASMHAGWFTYDHIRMRIRMCRFMLEGMAMHRAVRAFISTLMAQLFDAHSRAGWV